MGIQRATTGGEKFEKLPHKQLPHQTKTKTKPKHTKNPPHQNKTTFTGELKLQEQLGQFKLSNSCFYCNSEHVRCFKVVVWMQYFVLK